jgi:hypothetical protein
VFLKKIIELFSFNKNEKNNNSSSKNTINEKYDHHFKKQLNQYNEPTFIVV